VPRANCCGRMRTHSGFAGELGRRRSAAFDPTDLMTTRGSRTRFLLTATAFLPNECPLLEGSSATSASLFRIPSPCPEDAVHSPLVLSGREENVFAFRIDTDRGAPEIDALYDAARAASRLVPGCSGTQLADHFHIRLRSASLL
jgi:hypothetical protein